MTPMIPATAAMLMITRIVRKVRARITFAPSGRARTGGSAGSSSSRDARRPLGALTGGVRADRRTDDHDAGVDVQLVAGDGHDEAVETAGCGTAALLADPAVLRAVAGALEPLRRLAPRDLAAQVHALLVQGDDALFHPGQDRLVLRDLLGLRQRVLGERHEVGAGLGHVVRLLVGVVVRDHVGEADPGVDLAAEATGGLGVEEADGGGAEGAEADGHRDEDAPVEELPAADAELLLVHRSPLRDGGGAPRRRCRTARPDRLAGVVGALARRPGRVVLAR